MNIREHGITLLHLDETLVKQRLLLDFPHEWIDCSDIGHSQGYCETCSLNRIRKRLAKRHYKKVTLIGNGNYHYISFLLMSEVEEPFSLVLFDHHADMLESNNAPMITCGSWVSYSLQKLPLLKKVLIIGVNDVDPAFSHKNVPSNVSFITEKDIRSLSIKTIEKRMNAFLDGDPIYLSIDKDVLYREDAFTNWDQGSMSLLQLIFLLRQINQKKKVIGLDVCGELPISPVELFSLNQAAQIKKNEIANRAILDILNS
nr:arginase family protein [Aneurinibacillus terranovensis]